MSTSHPIVCWCADAFPGNDRYHHPMMVDDLRFPRFPTVPLRKGRIPPAPWEIVTCGRLRRRSCVAQLATWEVATRACYTGPTCDTLKQVQIATCRRLLTFRIMNFIPVGTFIMYKRSTGTTVPDRVYPDTQCPKIRGMVWRYSTLGRLFDIQVGECDIPPVWPN